MPKLNDRERELLNERLALQRKLYGAYEDRQYFSQHCRLCNWASNGRTIEEAIVANEEHEATHPETAQLKAVEVDPWEIVDSLHDHDCEMRYCACKCGCQEGPFCILVMGPLCSGCLVGEKRGNGKHGEKEG